MRSMRIAVAGAAGNIGARTVAALERAGHEVVRISRSLGVDLITGDGLDAALARRTNDARGHMVKLVPTWSSLLGPEMAGDVLLPVGARIAPTTFDEWLAKPHEHHPRPSTGMIRRHSSGATITPTTNRLRNQVNWTGVNRRCLRRVIRIQMPNSGHRADGDWMLPGARRAKRPVSPYLAGAYGHPYHPALASAAIGAWVASLIFDVSSHAVSKPGFLTAGSEWLIAIGIAGGVAAVVTGFLDLAVIPAGTRAYQTACTHMSINTLVISGYALDFAWRRHTYRLGAPVSAGMLTLSAVCLALVAASGFLGGTLAYRFGVRVADEYAQADGYRPHRGRPERDGLRSDAIETRPESDRRWD